MWLRLQLWLGSDPWPRTPYATGGPKMKRKKIRTLQIKLSSLTALYLSSPFKACHHYEWGVSSPRKNFILYGFVVYVSKKKIQTVLYSSIIQTNWRATHFIHLLWVYDVASLMDLELIFPFHYYMAGIQHLNDFTILCVVNPLLIDIHIVSSFCFNHQCCGKHLVFT